ncbi:VIR protein [Plasmodium vivax]|uniref:VIR protein n=1 Tax=Plasmodium vivax TaxID=5855 RepID=A0A1G4EAC5_PLAVI|nr:VIR protein [Plasmodium vivax]
MDDCDEVLRTSLFTYSQYNIFNQNVEVKDQNVECEKLSKEFTMYRNFKNFCQKLSGNIKNVCIFMSEPPRKREPSQERETLQKEVYCDNLNYWLYDILIKSKVPDNEKNILKSKIIHVFSKLWDTTNCNENCELSLYDIDTNDFGYMKELYDYSKSYKAMEYYTSNLDALECKSQYCSYINKVDKIYKIAEQKCSSAKDKPYCTIYDNIPKDKIPSEFFRQYKCTQNDVVESLVNDEKIFGTKFQILEYDNNYSSSVSSRVSGQDSPVALDQSTSEQSPSNNSAKVGLTLFGMSSIPLFLIYKFTPGGNFIRKLIRKNSGSMSISDNMSSQDWFGLSPEYQNDGLQNKRFEVLYQAMRKP